MLFRSLFHEVARRITDALTNVLLYRNLTESEDKYRSLVENSNDGIFRSDATGRLLDVNPSLVRMLGFSAKADLLGSSIPEDLCFSASDWQAVREGDPLSQIRIRRRDGREVWVEINSRAIREPSGAVVGFEGSVRDLSERVEAEVERRQLEAQIQHAQKLESLGLLAGGIAHDFNNLLMGILGNSGMALMEMAPDAVARESVERIETAALQIGRAHV